MTLTANVKEMYAPQDLKTIDDVQVKFDILDLSPDVGNLYNGTEIMNLGEFKDLFKNQGYKAGNFSFNRGIPKPLNELFTMAKAPLENNQDKPRNEITLVYLLTELAKYNSKIVFQKKYYSNHTGGNTFDNFEPDLTDVELSSRNLIISRKKFNIVLTASIKGTIYVEGGQTEAYRYFPFKIVKYGKLVYNELYVVLDKYNASLLSQLADEIVNDVAKVDLTKFPIFETSNIDISTNNFLHLLRDIHQRRTALKSFRYFLSSIRHEIDLQGIEYDKREWFSGEEVDDEYLSDEGTEFIDVWEKGKKGILNLQNLLSDLDKFGEGIKTMVDNFNHISNLEKQFTAEPIEKCQQAILKLFNDKVLKQEEFLLLASLLIPMSLTGTHVERYKEIKDQIKLESLKLNILEMKLLTLRWNLLNNFDKVPKLGEIVSRTKDKINLQSPQGTIVIKRGTIEKSPSNVIPMISEEIEGVTK